MKKYSTYFKSMMALAVISALNATVLLTVESITPSATLYVVAFIFAYSGAMAPDSEKYKS